MRVLVVGGSGFLGGAIARELSATGAEVFSLSRSGRAWAGHPVVGDVTQRNLGLRDAELHQLVSSLTHVVSCAGSVDWAAGPREALEVHKNGTTNVFALARRCPRLERVVHVSSILALGRATGRIGNRELFVGQRFRNWYEYGKYAAEHVARNAAVDVPTRIVRFGPLLGVDPQNPLTMGSGITATLPFLLQGHSVHLENRGQFPCYAGEVRTAALVVRRALESGDGPQGWTWFDPALPSLHTVLTELCRPWGVVPRIVDLPALNVGVRLVARSIGLPKSLLDYTSPWIDLDTSVLGEIPGGVPACPPGYIEATGRALLDPSEQREVGRLTT
jgi:nucleoside-diphosphate-sugar epimerase